ncbi:MAG: TonB family protein [Azoarcus sp.]|jgi:TonB family protein|nr:TonB family protein [Azoarcus sp.]
MEKAQQPRAAARLSMPVALAVSLALHALPAGAWLALAALPRVAPTKETVLAMENIGILSESNHEAMSAPPPPPEAAPPASEPPPPKPLPKRRSPVRTPIPRERLAAAPAPAPAPSAAAANISDDGETRAAQHAAEAEQKRLTEEYKRRLFKHIDRFLRYPVASKLAGETGYPSVAFTLTVAGGILPGTLRVTQSSGFPALDEASLTAVRRSVPFPKPPRQIEVEYGFRFDKRDAPKKESG